MATDRGSRPEQRTTRPTLQMGRVDSVSFLIGAAIPFSNMDRMEAQRFQEQLISERDQWLRARGRRLPSPEQLDRERYGSDNRGGRYAR